MGAGKVWGVVERGEAPPAREAGWLDLAADQPQPEAQAEAGGRGQGSGHFEDAGKRGDEGLIDLCHRGEAGFAMTRTVTSSWCVKGEPMRIPYEAPQGRRVNAV